MPFTHPHIIPNVFSLYFIEDKRFGAECSGGGGMRLFRKLTKKDTISSLYDSCTILQVFWSYIMTLCDEKCNKYKSFLSNCKYDNEKIEMKSKTQ